MNLATKRSWVTLEKAISVKWYGQMALWFEEQKGGEKSGGSGYRLFQEFYSWEK